jgi:hypothetical protein
VQYPKHYGWPATERAVLHSVCAQARHTPWQEHALLCCEQGAHAKGVHTLKAATQHFVLLLVGSHASLHATLLAAALP